MRTIASVLRALFPTTQAEAGADTARPAYMRFPDAELSHIDVPYANAPLLPFDVFAVTGHLLELSGAYHHIVSISRVSASARSLEIGSDDLRLIRRMAKSWRAYDVDGFTDDDLGRGRLQAWLATDEGFGTRKMRELWAELVRRNGDEPVFNEDGHTEGCPAWWRTALLLFVTADEAARGVGFNPIRSQPRDGEDASPWFERIAYEVFFGAVPGKAGKEGTEISPMITFSAADVDTLCVLPKSRTPSVGCTMRSLTHNLALLPPRGVSKGGWIPFLFQSAPPDEMHMNILLVPMPFKVRSAAFKPKISEATEGQSFGVFALEQDWLATLTVHVLADFIAALAAEATKEVDRIHAVVFPEMALNRQLYGELVTVLPERLSGIELLVSGVSQDQPGREGNFVSMTVFHRDGSEGKPARAGFTAVREKHHRWRLDGQQIVAYGLEGVMSTSVGWWEDLDILGRRVDFAVVRSGSVVSTMICEDLARVDPCQQLIRAVGPSMIFALLMDAPQLKARWPARHATILAEDPGSAVLTLTSKGLMQRQHRLGIHVSKGAHDRVIALWRDDTQASPIEIACPDETYGVVLSLSGARVVDKTLDGRTDGSAVSWRYARHTALKVADAKTKFLAVVGDDP